MSPHTEWVGGNPFAAQLQATMMQRPKTRKAGATRPAPERKPRAAKKPPGRPPEPRCANCLFSTFRKDTKNRRDQRKSPALCTLKHISVCQDDGRTCGSWEYGRRRAVCP